MVRNSACPVQYTGVEIKQKDKKCAIYYFSKEEISCYIFYQMKVKQFLNKPMPKEMSFLQVGKKMRLSQDQDGTDIFPRAMKIACTFDKTSLINKTSLLLYLL